MIQYYYYIDEQRVYPSGNDKKLVWEIYNDEIFGRYKLDKPIEICRKVDQAGYDYLVDNKDSTKTFEFKIEQDNNGTVSTFYEGKFKNVNIDFSNYYKGILKVKITTYDEYDYILKNYDITHNILNGNFTRYNLSYTYEPKIVFYSPADGIQSLDNLIYPIYVSVNPEPPSGIEFAATNEYIIKNQYSINNYPENGIPIIDVNDDTKYIYMRLEFLHRFTSAAYGGYDESRKVWYAKVAPTDPDVYTIGPLTYERAFKLYDGLDYLIDLIGYEIESSIFNLSNYVTGENPNPLRYLYLIQKSDFKTREPDEPATVQETSLKKMLSYINALFNIYWHIDEDGYFKLEHISAFKNSVSLDLTTSEYEQYINTRINYKYKEEILFNREVYKSNEAESVDFIESKVIYDNVLLTGEENVDTKDSGEIITDYHYVQNNPSKVSDIGFMLLNTDSSLDIEFYESILGNYDVANMYLSWANLITKYHRHHKPFLTGTINGVETSMLSLKKNKEQETITILEYIDIDPMKLVKTNMGDGEVEKMVINLDRNIIELTLLHD